MKIVLDSNFMMIPFNLKTDIYQQLAGHELLAIRECIAEVESKMPAAADFARKKGVKIIDEKLDSKAVDDKILEFAHKHNTYIATVDKELKLKCEAKGVPVLTLRQGRCVVGF
jgi:rRNA-processing protein FCF1